MIGFDVVQSESTAAPAVRGLRDRVPGVDDATWGRVHDALDSWSAEDGMLADAVGRSGRVILGYFFDFSASPSGSKANQVDAYGLVRDSAGGIGHRRVPQANAAVGNLEELRAAALGSGYFNVFPDPNDGLYRRVPVVVRYNDGYALPLSLAMVRAHRDGSAAAIKFASFGAEEVRLGKQRIPVAEDGQMLLNFRGPGKSFRHVPAVDVLEGRVDPDVFRDKLVLIGVTATAVADIRPTPFDGVYPGVEIHATVIDNVLRGEFLRRPQGTVLLEISAMMLLAVGLGLALRNVRGSMAAFTALAFAGRVRRAHAVVVHGHRRHARPGLPGAHGGGRLQRRERGPLRG